MFARINPKKSSSRIIEDKEKISFLTRYIMNNRTTENAIKLNINRLSQMKFPIEIINCIISENVSNEEATIFRIDLMVI